jgi:hypothetical protein
MKLEYSTLRSVRTQQFIIQYISVATSFHLQSHHQAILNHISIGTISSCAHFWGPKIFTIIGDYGYKCGCIYGNTIKTFQNSSTRFYCITKWVISEVLHNAYFLFENECILQNTFTGLKCNLHCALSQWSNNGDYIWRPVKTFCTINSFLRRKKYSVQKFWNDPCIYNTIFTPAVSYCYKHFGIAKNVHCYLMYLY